MEWLKIFQYLGCSKIVYQFEPARHCVRNMTVSKWWPTAWENVHRSECMKWDNESGELWQTYFVLEIFDHLTMCGYLWIIWQPSQLNASRHDFSISKCNQHKFVNIKINMNEQMCFGTIGVIHFKVQRIIANRFEFWSAQAIRDKEK